MLFVSLKIKPYLKRRIKMEMKSIKTIIIRSIVDFLDWLKILLEQKEYLIYRGVHSSMFELIPSIGRLKTYKNKTLTVDDEKNMLEEFKSRAYSRIRGYNYNTLELLTYGQHHGLATRLLDWTKNPLVATYFAVEKPFEGDEDYSCVYVYKMEKRPNRGEVFDPFALDKKDVKVYVPNHLDERITRQDSYFTVHGNPYVAWNSLDVEKVLIDKDIRGDLKIKLNWLGINGSTVYPEVDGIGKYVTWALSDLY